MQHLHQHRKEHKASTDNHTGIVMNPHFIFLGHKRSILHSFNKHEINDSRCSHTTKHPDNPFQFRLIAKGENDTRQILYQCAKRKGYCNREKYSQNHSQCLLRVQQLGKSEPFRPHSNLYQCQRKSTPQQLKHHRHRCRRRHTQCIKHIQQDYIRDHHRQKNTHQLIKIKGFRPKNTMPRNVHHAVTHRSTAKNTDCSNDNNGPERSRFSSNS